MIKFQGLKESALVVNLLYTNYGESNQIEDESHFVIQYNKHSILTNKFIEK